jgi:hypothetical protein
MDLVVESEGQRPLSDRYVREMREQLDQLERMLRRAPAAGFDTTEALEDIATLRRALDLGGAIVALAISTAWSLDRQRAKIKLPDPASRGGMARVAKVQQGYAGLLRTARRECPNLLAKSASAAADWLVKNGKTDLPKDRVRKILGKLR